jgi:Asp-tRNA(Asn)/Glu-tRNA(Gln) amidotransferase A subunit family amidase
MRWRDTTPATRHRSSARRRITRARSRLAAARDRSPAFGSACREYFGEGIDADVAAAIEAALGELRTLGATTVEITLANVGLAVPVYYVIAPAEASSNLSRFDGVRYGHRATAYSDLDEMYERTRAEGFGAEVKRRILVGTYVLSHGYYDAYYLKAQQVRRLIAEDFRRAYRSCDVIVGPTTPTAAFRLGAKTDDPVEMYLNDIFTVAANLTGAPALSIPCGFDRNGLPSDCRCRATIFRKRRCSTSRIGSSKRPTGIKEPPRSPKVRARCPPRGRSERLGAALRRSKNPHARRRCGLAAPRGGAVSALGRPCGAHARIPPGVAE